MTPPNEEELKEFKRSFEICKNLFHGVMPDRDYEHIKFAESSDDKEFKAQITQLNKSKHPTNHDISDCLQFFRIYSKKYPNDFKEGYLNFIVEKKERGTLKRSFLNNLLRERDNPPNKEKQR